MVVKVDEVDHVVAGSIALPDLLFNSGFQPCKRLSLTEPRLIRERECASQQIDATSRSRIPIIVMTANAMQGDRERRMEAGMDDYITKPLGVQSLADALDKWLPVISVS